MTSTNTMRDAAFEVWAKKERLISDFEYARVQTSALDLYRECWEAACEWQAHTPERVQYKSLGEIIAATPKHIFDAIEADCRIVDKIATAFHAHNCHHGVLEEAYILGNLAMDIIKDEISQIPPPVSNEFVEEGCEQFSTDQALQPKESPCK